MSYLIRHHLAGATMQIANLVNYNCNPIEDGNNLGYLAVIHAISA